MLEHISDESQKQTRKNFGHTQVKSTKELVPGRKYVYHWKSESRPELPGATPFKFLTTDYHTRYLITERTDPLVTREEKLSWANNGNYTLHSKS